MSELHDRAEAAWNSTPEQVPAFQVLSLDRSVHELAEGCGVLPFVYNVMPVATDEGMVLIDSGLGTDAEQNHERLRAWSEAPLHTAVFTHGHADHAYGIGPFDAEADGMGWDRPRVIAHEAITERFDRYTETHGYNTEINARQFFGFKVEFPREHRYPDVTYRDRHDLEIGGRSLQLHHARGETDDHTWVWMPDEKILYPGDLFVWVVPNAGNPQKVQRYAKEWALALREMIDHGPEILVPSHGLPIFGAERVEEALASTAELLDLLHDQTVALMNEGATLDEIVHTVRVPDELLAKPWLGATYDEPEFIIRNVWRLRGGWYDGDPAHLKPPPERELATEVADLAGGAGALADRALAVAESGDLRLAAQLVEWAGLAGAADPAVHKVRADIYSRLVDASTSLMARGVYGAAVRDSDEGAAVGPSLSALTPDS